MHAASYTAAVVVAEAMVVVWRSAEAFLLSMGIHSTLVFTLLAHASILKETDETMSRFLAVLSLVPLIRILSLALPFTPFTELQWLLLMSLPLVAGPVTLMLVLRLRPRDAHLRLGALRGLPLQGAVALSGLGLGVVEFFILEPEEAWIPALEVGTLVSAALILGLATGLAEELIFRGLLLSRAETVYGRLPALLLVSLLFAALHIGFVEDWRTALDLPFVFGVGVYLGLVVQRTQNLSGVIVAHGLANVSLYLVLPFYV